MTIGLRQGSVITEIGPGELFHSVFSTIAVRIENGQWGTRFPIVMNELYQGSVSHSDADTALNEMLEIRKALQLLPPDQVIWDAENPSKDPPWGRTVGPHVKSCAQYWVTTTGRNIVDEIIDNLESLREFGGTLDVISYDGAPKF